MKTIKKYTNRRLYDTDQSKYITLEELAELIRDGHDVEVVAAKSNEDLTQAVLAQIVVESRGAARLLPAPLLTQMIRMEEDALAEFMGLYMSWALEVYFQVKSGFREMNPYQIFGNSMPFNPTQALGRLFSRQAPWTGGARKPPAQVTEQEPPPPPESTPEDEALDLAALQREIKRLNERLDDISEE